VFSQHTRSVLAFLSCAVKQQVKAPSLQALGARHDRSTTYVGVYGDRGRGWASIETHHRRHPSSCCCNAMRYSNGAKDAPRSSPIGFKVAWHVRIPLHKRENKLHRWRGSDGAKRGHKRHESSTEETQGQPSMCAWVQVREEEYLL